MSTVLERSEMEYTALMEHGRSVERTAQFSWIAGALSAGVLLSWAIAAKSPGLMIPVVFAIAVGFYGLLRGRQQVRWMGSYVEVFYEGPDGPQWFTRVHRLQTQPGYRPIGDWLIAILANVGNVLAVILAWMYASSASRGDLMAAIVTACGVIFGFHSVAETMRIMQTDSRSMWRRANSELQEVPRPRQVGAL